jgi:hypothetical protein
MSLSSLSIQVTAKSMRMDKIKLWEDRPLDRCPGAPLYQMKGNEEMRSEMVASLLTMAERVDWEKAVVFLQK